MFHNVFGVNEYRIKIREYIVLCLRVSVENHINFLLV